MGASGHAFRWYVSVMALTLPLIVLTYLLMALFQAMGHYSLQGSLSLLYNISLCVLLLAAGPRMSVAAFAAAASAAWVLQLAMTLPCLVRERYRFHFRLDLRAGYLPLYLRTAVVTAFTTAIFLFCYLMDTNMASPMGEGVTSAFYYADKLFTPVITTLIYSIGAVMFPQWSEKHASMADGEYRAYVGGVVESTVLLLLPLSALFSVFGVPIIRVLFEGGSFTPESSALTGMVFARYALGMVGFALLDLLAKAYYAMQDTRAPLVVNLGVLGGNFILNLVLLELFPSPGALAVGTALAIWLYNNFVGWLNFLNATLPPVGAIVILDYLLHRNRYRAKAAPAHTVHWGAVAGVIAGAAAGNFLPGLTAIRPEYVWEDSRFDFLLEDAQGKIFVEVKGVTLEEDGEVRFPDAPTERGVKHLRELAACRRAGYEAAVCFVLQMAGMRSFSPNDATHPAFGAALRAAAEAGVSVLAVECTVAADRLTMAKPVPVLL